MTLIQQPYSKVQAQLSNQAVQMYIRNGILRKYNSSTGTVDVEVQGMGGAYLKNIATSKNLNALGDSASSSLLTSIGSRCLVATYDQSNPNANVVIAIY